MGGKAKILILILCDPDKDKASVEEKDIKYNRKTIKKN